MSKILLTGMTAPQSSVSANNKSFSFSGLVHNVLVSDGSIVDWINPSVSMSKENLSSYDSVIVGVSPVTSMSSNRLYGAINIISELWGDERLTILIDTPNLSQIEISLRNVVENKSNLIKPFFSYRKEYSEVVNNPELVDKIFNCLVTMLTSEWGNVIYPALPWKKLENIKLPPNIKKNLNLVNLDSHIISELSINFDRREKWVIDTKSTKWSESVVNTLSLPNSPMKWNKGWNDTLVQEQITRSIGALISPDKKDGTYWNYRYIQSMNTNTPIATDWKESSAIGDAWNLLASSIEDMSQSKRDLIALSQREMYLANIPSKQLAIEKFYEAIKLGDKNG